VSAFGVGDNAAPSEDDAAAVATAAAAAVGDVGDDDDDELEWASSGACDTPDLLRTCLFAGAFINNFLALLESLPNVRSRATNIWPRLLVSDVMAIMSWVENRTPRLPPHNNMTW
jgi:hypothetical protein